MFHTRVSCHFVETVCSLAQEHDRFQFYGCVLWATPSCHHFHAQPLRVAAKSDPIRFRETRTIKMADFAKARRCILNFTAFFRNSRSCTDHKRKMSATGLLRESHTTNIHSHCIHINEIQRTNSRHVTFQSIIEACAQALLM